MECNRGEEQLRKQFLQEAREAIRGLEENDSILAAILTGSAVWGKPNPDGDIDILLITRGQRGVRYRYLVPKFCPVKRRTELGCIPYETALQHIEKGYATLISCSLIEQLKNGRVLFQKGTQGDDLVALCRNARPSLMTVGALINELGEAVRLMEEALDLVQFEEAILMARRAAQLSVRGLLLAREKVGVSKEKHEYRAVRNHLAEREAGTYEKLMGIEGIVPESARRTLDQSIALMKWVLERFSLSPSLVNYDRRKGIARTAA